METSYTHADDIKTIAQEVVDENPDEFKHIDFDTVVFVRTTKHIKSDYVLGRCIFLPYEAQFLADKKYMIVCPPVFDTLTPPQKKIVVEHEIMHIDPEGKGLIPHDIGEFKKIVDKYGLEWLNTFKESNKKIELLKEKEKLEKKLKKQQEK